MKTWLGALAVAACLLAPAGLRAPSGPETAPVPRVRPDPRPLRVAPAPGAASAPQTAVRPRAGVPPVRSASALRRAIPAEGPRAVRVTRAALGVRNVRSRAFRARHRDRSSARALDALRASDALRAGEGRPAGDDVLLRYRLQKDRRPVWNRGGVLRVRDGQVVDRAGFASLPPTAAGAVRLGAEEAVAGARAALPLAAGADRAAPRVSRGWYATGGRTVPAWRVVVPTADPIATWQVTLDARDGRVLSRVDLVRTARGVGTVYDPNVALAPLPSSVLLEDLDDSGHLSGRWVRIVDQRAPTAFRPDLVFDFPVDDPRFVQTNVYHGVTETARLAEAGGLAAFGDPLVAFTNHPGAGAGGEFNNAFYDPFFRLLVFGNGDGVLTDNLGTDLDVAAHETGHHVFQVLVDPELAATSDPALAMSEGVADTFAALVGGDPDVGESTIPGAPFLRTLDNAAVFPDGISDDPHTTGLILGGLHWDLIALMGEEDFTGLLLAALAGLPSDADFLEYRDAFLQANQATRGGAQQVAIDQLFRDRGFDDLELPEGFEGVVEEGIPETRTLPDSPFTQDPSLWNFHVFLFQEFPGSREVRFRTTGTGDVDLLVVGLDDPLFEVATSESPGSDETITLTPSSSPPVDRDDLWLVFVFDFPDLAPSRYTLTVDSVLPSPAIAVDGPDVEGRLDSAGDLDLLTFDAAPGQVVRVEVEALDEDLDPVAGVFDAIDFELLAVDDDDGPGRSATIQGVTLPHAGPWALAILALGADVDPSIGGGRYAARLATCDNASGPDTDGDGLRDACDDDDDGDGFDDPEDAAPLDPDRCFDLDGDGCDDCAATGAFDPFNDGPDADGDGLCDAGDPDDDDDGCEDAIDPRPMASSVDVDLDFVGADCDTCTEVADPGQPDRDGDGFGDRCDCDFDGDGFCTLADFNRFLPDFVAGTETTLGTDMDGDGAVTLSDFNHFLPGFVRGAPGPSGRVP